MATKQILNSSTAPDGSQYVTLTDGVGNLVTAGGASGITIGTTTITGGADTQVLFNNAGVVGSDAGLTKVSGATGAVTIGGALSLPATGSTSATVLNFGTANTGIFGTSNAILLVSSGSTIVTAQPGQLNVAAATLALGSTAIAAWNSDTFITRGGAAATIKFGSNADVAAPVAQTLKVQSVVAGTSNTAGVDFTVIGSLGTGTGLGGSILFKTALAGTTGTAQNAAVTGLTVKNGSAVLSNYTVAGLPPAATSGSGGLAFVTDATLTAITGLGLAVIGGGANKVVVYSDGTNWLIL